MQIQSRPISNTSLARLFHRFTCSPYPLTLIPLLNSPTTWLHPDFTLPAQLPLSSPHLPPHTRPVVPISPLAGIVVHPSTRTPTTLLKANLQFRVLPSQKHLVDQDTRPPRPGPICKRSNRTVSPKVIEGSGQRSYKRGWRIMPCVQGSRRMWQLASLSN